jgi:hypothetical protein
MKIHLSEKRFFFNIIIIIILNDIKDEHIRFLDQKPGAIMFFSINDTLSNDVSLLENQMTRMEFHHI